jgi:hypothetical protein
VHERLLPIDEEVVKVYGIGRSGRQGYATHATSIGILDADIKILARSPAVEAAAGRAASLPGGMPESYAKIGQMRWSLLRASRPL